MNAKKLLLLLLITATIFSIGHHIDHVIRGNHTGWPLTDELTPFTFSLFIYIPIALGFYLQAKKKVGALYWLILTVLGSGFVIVTHLIPGAVEPPTDIIDVYHDHTAGLFAFSWLVFFNIALFSAAICSAYVVFRERKNEKA